LPEGVQQWLSLLLHQQDCGEPLTDDERRGADGLANLADLFSLRAERLATQERRPAKKRDTGRATVPALKMSRNFERNIGSGLEVSR